jgi:hypothetical protein
MDKCASLTPPAVFLTNASLLRAVVGGAEGHACHSAAERIGKRNPYDKPEWRRAAAALAQTEEWAFVFVGVVGARCSFLKCLILSMAGPVARYFRHAEGTSCDERERGYNSIVT